MPAKAGRKAKPLSQNLDELEQKLIDLANAQREEDDVRGEEKESLLTKEGKAERKKKIKEITNKKSVLSRAINDIRGRLKRQTKEQKSQAIMKQVNDRLDQINQNPKVDIQITKTRLQRLKGFLGIGQQTEQKEQDPAQTPPSGRRSPGRMSPSGTPEAPGSQASSIVPSGMATPEEEEEPIQYASVGDISREQKAQFDKEDTVKRLVDGALIGAVIELQSENKLTDNVNKAEEKGSNTQIITPEYLLRDRPRSEIVEMKRGIPPPNQRPQINELLNSEVEPVPDVININQNQIGINERIARQRQQDITFQKDDLGYEYQQTKKILEQKRQDFRTHFDEPYDEWRTTKTNLNNPSSSSSNPDNINYENNREDKTNQILEFAESVGSDTQSIYADIENLSDNEFENIFTNMFGPPPQEQQLEERKQAITSLRGNTSGRGMLSGLEESQLGQRLGQIGAGAQAGAIAGARQGMQGGLRGAMEGGLEGGVRGGVAAGIAGQLGGGFLGQLAQMGAQEGISDILGRIRRMGGDGPDGKVDDDGDDRGEGDDIKRQIDNINQELGQITDPLKYPEFKEKEIYRFPGPGEQKKGIQLVQNSITEYLNDVNLYGGGFNYEPVMDL